MTLKEKNELKERLSECSEFMLFDDDAYELGMKLIDQYVEECSENEYDEDLYHSLADGLESELREMLKD